MPDFHERYEGSPQQCDIICERNVMIPMRDGVRLATDLYFPALRGRPAAGRFPVILERTPYDKAAAGPVVNGEYFARRGYVCAVQDVRGRFVSEGDWYPFAKEAPDGYDTVEWLGTQDWSDGRVGTMGASYAGSDQSALATLSPPHLKTMIVAVGASNYYHCSMRQNGALEQRFMIYAFRMATTSKEALADVPTLYLGGWYDSYARATCENFVALRRMKRSPQVLLMGPWTHGGWGVSYAGDVDFGTHAIVNYNDLRLAWFDRFLKGLRTEVAHWAPVKLFIMGTGDGKVNYLGRLNHGGEWRDAQEYPLPETRFTPYYLYAGCGLSATPPPGEAAPSRYSFDPRDPVPTISGGISAADPVMQPGGFDQCGRLDFYGCKDTLPLNARSDVLTFQTAPLDQDLQITGPITVTLYASSSARDTDFTAKLIDVYPPTGDYTDGLAINLTDSIIRARYRNGWEQPELLEPGEVYAFTFALYPTANVFMRGHRIRLDVSSSNFPRFDVNPNTGGDLGVERRFEIAHQSIYHDAAHPSHILLPVIPR